MLKKESLPAERSGFTKRFVIFGELSTLKGYVTVSFYPDGRVGEFFLVISKEGSTMSGFADLWAQSCSRLFHAGYTVADFVEDHENVHFEPSGRTNDSEIPVARSVADYLAKYIKAAHAKFLATLEPAEDAQAQAS